MGATDKMTSSPEAELISGWFDAFNRRDLEGMLECLSPAIVFHPLRFPGVEHRYQGHEGIRSWFDAVTEGRHVHRIESKGFSHTDDGRVLVSGSVTLAVTGGLAPFSGIYVVANGRIAEGNHYFTPTAVLDRLGMI